MIATVISDDSISVVINGRPYQIPKTSAVFGQVMEALRAGKSELDVELVCRLEGAVRQYSSGDIQIQGDVATYRGRQLPAALTKRLLWCLQEKVPFANLQRFIERLYANPSARTVEQLYPFLEFANIPITDQGHFVAYKAIRNNWRDKHSDTYRNMPGDAPRMERNAVDDDPEVGCSCGFHVGNLQYVTGFAHDYGSENGDRIVLVDVDPADVVSVPHDCSHQKVRTCSYRVIQEYTGPLPSGGVDRDLQSYESTDDDDFDIDVRTYTKEDLDEAAEEAREAGYEEGRRAGKAEVLAAVEDVVVE